MEQQMIFSVSEANNFIKALLDRVPQLQEIFVRGEISNYKLYPSGHHYFTLKDAEGAMRCVLFKGNALRLRFRPENGMKVIAFGRISVFPRDGAYQLYVSELSPEGAGDLHVAFEQLKAQLEREGLFDPAHKKPLPKYPKTIAIITSPAGAAVHDMLRILRARWPLTEVKLLGVRVQGTEAPPEIVGALRYANSIRSRTSSSRAAAAAPSRTSGRSTTSVWRVPSMNRRSPSSPPSVTSRTSPSPTMSRTRGRPRRRTPRRSPCPTGMTSAPGSRRWSEA